MFIFPDTHFFLHFKHPQEIPWAEIVTADPISLVVGRTIQKEIEKHKYEMRGRPQDRAREYATKLAQIVLSAQPIVLRSSSPRVVLDYRPERPSGWLLPPGLDESWNDDMFVADVLSFTVLNPGQEMAILTGDPGVMARAKAFGITVLNLSERGWELPVEKTSQERELEKLRREADALRRTGPAIICEIQQDAQDAGEIKLHITRYPPLLQGEVDVIVEEARSRHPRVDNFMASLDPALWSPPAQEQIEQYHKAYDTWLHDLLVFLENAPETLNSPLASVDIHIAIRNNGSAPAEHTRLTIEALGGFLLVDLDGTEASHEQPPPTVLGKFRRPPVPPMAKRIVQPSLARSRMEEARKLELEREKRLAGLAKIAGLYPPEKYGIGSLDRLARFGIDILNPFAGINSSTVPPAMNTTHLAASLRRSVEPRDRHAFYWNGHPDSNGSQVWNLECDEFQHQMKPVIFNARLTEDSAGGTRARGGSIAIQLSARNLREPFRRDVPVRIVVSSASTREVLLNLLPR